MGLRNLEIRWVRVHEDYGGGKIKLTGVIAQYTHMTKLPARLAASLR
ncbi:hypothetical protein SAMN05428962_2089 [Paenibacillus sp. BC26]|nr:hypothetical protein SAMN05428962_2089 [Paenibacillus sp. BC26]